MRTRLILLSFIIVSLLILFQACENEGSLDYKRYYINGKGLYEKNCQSCHGILGEGLAKLYPPLSDSTYLLKNKNKLACIIRYGQHEKISIGGVEYDTEMPGNTGLTEMDIAQLIVYISNSFGNKQGFYETSQVNSDLKDCKSVQ